MLASTTFISFAITALFGSMSVLGAPTPSSGFSASLESSASFEPSASTASVASLPSSFGATTSSVSTFDSTTSSSAPTPSSSPATGEPMPIQPSAADNEELITKLLLAPTAADRVAILSNDADYTFNFAKPANSTGLGGSIVGANRKNMPALIGQGSSMAVGFLGPCGFNTPHTHPRGTELQIVVEGSIVTTMILENGARAVHTNLSTYGMTVFPQGSLHQQFNPDCEPTVFVAAFNTEDAGTQQTQDTFFMLDDNVIKAAFGGGEFFDGQDIDRVRHMIPKSVALGVDQCLQKCGISKRR